MYVPPVGPGTLEWPPRRHDNTDAALEAWKQALAQNPKARLLLEEDRTRSSAVVLDEVGGRVHFYEWIWQDGASLAEAICRALVAWRPT
jgi:hypothetical protein